MRHVKLVTKYLSVQIVVQAMLMLAGLFIVRTMGKHEYALYTIANTIQSTISVVSDVGVTSALSVTGGLVWQDPYRFGQLLHTGLEYRKRMALAAAAIAAPILLWMLMTHGAPVFYALVIVVISLAGVGIQLENGVLIVAPRLHTRVAFLQKIDLLAAGVRLAIVAAICAIWFLLRPSADSTAFVLASAVVAYTVQRHYLKRSASADAILDAPVRDDDWATMRKLVRQQAPGSIYYCLQSQISLFLISTFGTTNTVAEVGALGRLTVIFTVIGSVMTNVVLPRFALAQDKAVLKAMYLRIVLAFGAISCFFVAWAALLPNTLLWLLGSKYSHLQRELVYMMFAAVISATSGALFSLNSTRGWVENAWIAIPITMVCQIGLIPFLDLKTVPGVVLLGALPTIPGTVPYIIRAWRGMTPD